MLESNGITFSLILSWYFQVSPRSWEGNFKMLSLVHQGFCCLAQNRFQVPTPRKILPRNCLSIPRFMSHGAKMKHHCVHSESGWNSDLTLHQTFLAHRPIAVTPPLKCLYAPKDTFIFTNSWWMLRALSIHQGHEQGRCNLNRLSFKSWRKKAQRFGRDGHEHTHWRACKLFVNMICLWFGGLKGWSSKSVFMFILNSVLGAAFQKQPVGLLKSKLSFVLFSHHKKEWMIVHKGTSREDDSVNLHSQPP